MIVGITGNSGSGKTTLANILEKEYNAYVINADKLAKKLSKPGEPYFEEIVKYFGEDILLPSGEINRSKLADIVFTDNEKRVALNLLTFNYVVSKVKTMLKSIQNEVIIIDAALLIESKLNDICDIVISVIAKKDIRIKRICKRDSLSKDAATKRVNAQFEDDFYINNSQIVVINNNENELNRQINDIKEIIQRKKRGKKCIKHGEN